MRIASFGVAAATRLYELGRFADESGASLLEYAIVLGLVSVVSIAALTVLGNQASQTLSTAASSITS